MKKAIWVIPLVLILLVLCSGFKEQKIIETNSRKLEISLSFNTDNYPWLLGTKYPQLAVWVETVTDNRTT